MIIDAKYMSREIYSRKDPMVKLKNLKTCKFRAHILLISYLTQDTAVSISFYFLHVKIVYYFRLNIRLSHFMLKDA